ncbi:RagB/SusD family nutrient uptake outer membrane protein [uncultured Bacteroides sp.]|uniref:RagB/SusD family nutrient uptake outer membrane protein n=1 Tax=uncultured Bacteroides sp. TaxID=162156 RepID=UPI00262845D3|nr:RagB/SusD family nutrient uptake outer membrane protein [uncultured Bacteroides sp.]
MKTQYKKLITTSKVLALAFTFVSCANELDISPINPQVNLTFSQNEVFAKVYATLGHTGQVGPYGNGDVAGIDEGTSAFYRLISTLNEFPSDEVLCSWNDVGIPEMNFISWGSSHNMVEGLYGRLMFDVTISNHFLEQTEGLDDAETARQRAEVRFIRALNYYYLMDMFGNPPFTEQVSAEKPAQIKRADLFIYIENELKDIENSLSEPGEAPFGRVDKAALWLLMSRLYLNAEVYTGTARWSEALTYAEKVIGTNYALCNEYEHLFMADNGENAEARKEMILPILQDGINIRTYGGALFPIASTRTSGMVPWGTSEGWGGVRARKALINKFFPYNNAPIGASKDEMMAAAQDRRALFYSGGYVNSAGDRDKDCTLEITNVNNFKEGFSIVKWSNNRSDGKPSQDPQWVDTDIPFFRLAEAYLTYAEAALRMGEHTDEALKAINLLRKRAGAAELKNLTLDNVLDEKCREFYFEGHRRTDLIRYGYFTSSTYLWDWKGGEANGTAVSQNYNLFPIPDSDIINNTNLTQNPGY